MAAPCVKPALRRDRDALPPGSGGADRLPPGAAGRELAAGAAQKPDAAGTKQGTALLLVIPKRRGSTARTTLDPGDRVLGEGPGVAWADWPGFVPAAVAGLAVVAYVLPLRLRGQVHHVEAGAWWNASGAGPTT